MRTLIYGINPSAAQEISLQERNPEKVANLVGKVLPQIAPKFPRELIEGFTVGIAEAALPVGGSTIRNISDKEFKHQRTLIDLGNMADLIENLADIS